MKTRSFIYCLENALKSADPTVMRVSLRDAEQKTVDIQLNDGSTISVDVEDCSLLEIIETAAFALIMEHRKDALQLIPQRVTRKGVLVNGEWRYAEELLMEYGQYVFVILGDRTVMIQNASTGKMIGGFLLD